LGTIKGFLAKLNPFRAPQCGDICAYKNFTAKGNNLTRFSRFHLTCLTCPIRRIYHNKTDKFVLKKHVLFEADCPDPRGVPVPKKYIAYFLLIPTTHMYKYDSEPIIIKLRIQLIKRILTFCEFLAQW
jgi:hypothetical protein